MKKTLLLFVTAISPMLMQAQELKEGYITWPASESLATYVSQWNGGNGKITVDGATWEDEPFFVSHVRPRTRFENTATQVYPTRVKYVDKTTSKDLTGPTTDKRVAYWVCVSDEARNGVKTNGLQNAVYDQEVFSLWSYIDNYGSWNSPFGWTPAVWTDICHKNGVGTHGVAGVPYGGISASWSSALTALGNLKAEDLGKFLLYHGQDGLGYNSEFSWNSASISKLITLHNGLKTYMEGKNPLWEIMWYAGTNDNASINFDDGIGNFTGLFAGASMFLNYNWNKTSLLNGAVTTAKNNNMNPMLVYAGMNMQGGEPKSGSNYDLLKDYQQSIGLWAGHNDNTIWKSRQSNGSAPATKQLTYTRDLEMFFGNGKRNPAIKQTITTNRAHNPSPDFAGMSSMVNARSTMNHTIKSEPFFTYFNIGNGQFFNWMGERMNDRPWYNIGVQDYLPSWRWWFAPALLQTDVTEGTTHLAADFTWEDAFVGGSCLKISGTSSKEYLHLLKTAFAVSGGNSTVTVRYKLLSGESDVRLVICPANNVKKNVHSSLQKCYILKAEDALADQDNSYRSGKDAWIEKTFTISTIAANNTNMPGGIGLVALEFTNAKNLELLLGEFSIKPENATAQPAKPTVKVARMLAHNSKGADGKIIWEMPNSKAVGEPVYNDEVNTSVFKMYAQQEGQEPVLMGITTAWAGHILQAPTVANSGNRMRLGISALSMDQRSESEIAWSEYMDLPDYIVKADIATDKPIIKPAEKFTMSFVDPQMSSATWTLKKAGTSNVVWSANGKSVTCPGLDEVGAYDLELTYDESRASTTVAYPRYISITSTSVGAMPEIYSLSVDNVQISENSADIEISLNAPDADKTKTFSYVGRYADGYASRGISLDEKWWGVGVDQLGLDAHESFTVAAWVRLDEIPDYSNFLTIENRYGSWPQNHWGWFWSRVNTEGGFVIDKVDGGFAGRFSNSDTEAERLFVNYKESKVEPGVWTHVAIAFEFNSANQMRMHLFINGKKQPISEYIYAEKGKVQDAVGGENGQWSDLSLARNLGNYGQNVAETPFFNRTYNLDQGMTIAFGGTASALSAVKAVIDDVQIWGKCLTESEVAVSLAGFTKDNIPDDVLAYWDFENNANSDYTFTGYTGKNAHKSSPKAFRYDINETTKVHTKLEAQGVSGSPFIGGEAYPIVTLPTWKTRGTQSKASGNGEEGSADISFTRAGDYTVDLTLANGHGSTTQSYPVVSVVATPTAIDGIEADGNGVVDVYTISGTLFLDFGADGTYDVMVFDTAGMLGASEKLNAVAGQTATISLGTKGVYLVKVVKDGTALRTVKVINK